ncbi:MAG TPA: flagellar hook-associated protein FlgL, partial [Clostridia bacterium]
MRVTNNMLVNNMLTQINKNLTRMEKYQNQLATGKKIQNPSDDPVVAARSLKLRTDVSQLNQYQSNAKDAKSWLDITESTLGEIGDVLQRARELAVTSSNGTQTAGDTQKTCEEVKQLKNQLVHLANTTYAGRYIFSGFTTDKPLMSSNGNFAINVTTATENINYEIGVGDALNINVTGGDLFNAGGDA